jgi:hypothetical protein
MPRNDLKIQCEIEQDANEKEPQPRKISATGKTKAHRSVTFVIVRRVFLP